MLDDGFPDTPIKPRRLTLKLQKLSKSNVGWAIALNELWLNAFTQLESFNIQSSPDYCDRPKVTLTFYVDEIETDEPFEGQFVDWLRSKGFPVNI